MNVDRGLPKALNSDVLLVVNAAVVTLAALWKLSWGFAAPGILDGLYETQAQSLAQGHAYLVPGPPQAYYHDSSMFHGRAYLYFGPLPSFILLLFLRVLGSAWSHYLITAVFLFLLFYCLQKLIAKVVIAGSEADPGVSPLWRFSAAPLLWCFLLAPSLSGKPFSLFYPNFYIYEQQVLFGLALAMAGLLALTRLRPGAESSWLAAAGLAFALAASVRPTWILAACGVLAAATITLLVRGLRHGARSIAPWEAGALAAGLSLMLLLGLWNLARFGSPTDFGVFFRQNCADDNMFRLSTGFFSWQSRLNGFFMNLLAYYSSPAVLEATGLPATASAQNGFLYTGFFFANPQWLPVLALAPLGLYRLGRVRRALLPLFVILLAAVVYVNIIVAGFPPANGPRYFTEFYLFLLLGLFAVLAAVLPIRLAIPGMLLLLSLQFVHSGLSSAWDFPNLRLLDRGPAARMGLNPNFNRDPGLDIYIVDRAVWPTGKVTPQDAASLTPYNAMGLYPFQARGFKSLDVAAAYIIPGSAPDQGGSTGYGEVGLRSVQSFSAPGLVKVYLEGALIGSLKTYPGRAVHGTFPVAFSLRPGLPYQVMMVFLPEGDRYLPPRPLPFPPWGFGSLSLLGRGEPRGD